MKKIGKVLLMGVFLAVSSMGFAATEFEVYSRGDEYANLREKPDKNSKILAKMENFDGGRIIRKEGNWYYVDCRVPEERHVAMFMKVRFI